MFASLETYGLFTPLRERMGKSDMQAALGGWRPRVGRMLCLLMRFCTRGRCVALLVDDASIRCVRDAAGPPEKAAAAVKIC